LEYITKMLPELKLDPDPLFKEAEQMEKSMKSTMDGIRQTTKRGDESLLYG
jgi:predicted ATP-grasp superfamily ATP-dependent carboligase